MTTAEGISSIQCRAELQALRDKYGYSIFFGECKALIRSRLQVDPSQRQNRKRFTSAIYNRLYRRQRGICPLCNLAMVKPNNFPGGLTVDHVDPNREDFGAYSNLQLTHASCNASKGGKSIQEQSKANGKTFLEIVGPGFVERDECP